MVYRVHWDPVAFLVEQDYDQPSDSEIGQAVTITGSRSDAQALSCREYMKQTWPRTGDRILRLLQSLLPSRQSSGGGRKYMGTGLAVGGQYDIWRKANRCS